MTQAQECLDKLCRNCLFIGREKCRGKCGAKRVLQVLVNKNTKKEVIQYNERSEDKKFIYTWHLCPNCNYEFTQENYLNKVNFCPKCGQHLMWELARWKTVSK